jgi:hypothetical protein
LQRETAAERGGEQACACGGSDERELRQVESHAARVGTLIDHDVDPEVFHRGVEILFHRFRDTVDFVDEQDVALLEVREQACEVAGFFHHGAGGDADVAFHFLTEDEREAGFAQTGRTAEQDVIEHIAAFAGRAGHHAEAFNRLGLPDEIIETLRPQRCFLRRNRRLESGGNEADALFRHGDASVGSRTKAVEG